MEIKVNNLLTPEAWEKLEDDIRDFLEEKGISATIENEITGNTTQTREDRD